ncbi:spore protease YyaC [Tepidibacter mesophilus]|uniref:spore protease YyaC n=1 Tax=Tepidibacter mesophilus TaxID=655607 RepID=UPI000C087FCF|nr:spore protease YyaC [Tepidibacter mesophilus]
MNEINIKDNNAYIHFPNILKSYIKENYKEDHKEIIILCIGTDRCTGDSLGPLIGYKLQNKINKYKEIYIHGTLEEPVHAKNLDDTIEYINKNYENPFIIAIDACLGASDRIGCIKVSNGALRPGAGVNKKLPSVGDINILGIVNVAGFMEFMVLQNTRLQLIMKMSDFISRGIDHALWTCTQKNQVQNNIF